MEKELILKMRKMRAFYIWGVYRRLPRLVYMKTTRMMRTWDRRLAKFVEVPVQRSLDCSLACKDCRYFDGKTQICQGVGSSYYQKRVTQPEFVPMSSECEVRLTPDLLSFIQC